MEGKNELEEYINKCILFYKMNSYLEKVKLFDDKFCKNNSENCLIIIKGEKQKIFSYYENENLENNIVIELLMKNNITDLSNMFNGCSSLFSMNITSNWNTKNITNMKWMFNGCTSLESLPDISAWDISNVNDIQFMFAGCKNLKVLPDISKWNTKNINNMSGLLSECSALKALPGISKWDTSNVININKIFSLCSSLTSLPDISKWNTSKTENMSFIFNECTLLSSLPDISKWNTSNVKNMSYMFNKCKTLISLPDISKWEMKNVTDISFMFSECIFLKSLPDLSKWNTSNILFMNSLFFKCHLLESLPDISKWNTVQVTNMNNMFAECSSLKELPNISKWNTSSVEEMVKMFADCSSLKVFPDISKWDFSSVYDKSLMFQGCQHDFLKEKIFCDDYDDNDKIIKELNIKADKNDVIRNDNLKFFPQIELKFNNVNVDNINKEMIENIKQEIRGLLKNDNFSIIEIKKGSLIIILCLQYIIFDIFDKIKKQKEIILDFNLDDFINNFSEEIKQEVEKVTNSLNHEFISLGSTKPDFIDKDIIDLTDENNKNKLISKIQSISRKKEENNNIVNEENNDVNIYEIGKIDELEIFFTRILQDAEQQEKNQFRLLKNLEEFNDLFDKEIEEALKKTYFEFKITHIFLVDKEKEDYITQKSQCENIIVKILYHGTKVDSAINILSTHFRDSTHHAIGTGVYFTDLLDYAWNYTSINPMHIPKVGESFSFVASEVYYDELKTEFVNRDDIINIYKNPVQKNGVRCCYGYFTTQKLNLNDLNKNKKPIGQEYLITEKSQILPLYTITVKRLEYLIIWRDYNFDSDNPNRYNKEVFQEMQEFHRKIKRIITRELNSKIYYTKTTEEALALIERKKYNKIFIITNANNNAKDFIKEARKILGSNVIVAISVYNIPLHIEWMKTMKNTLILNGEEFHFKYLKALMKMNVRYLEGLKDEIINHYVNTIPNFGIGEFNNDILRFPKFKSEGLYNDLTFNELDEKKCQIF